MIPSTLRRFAIALRRRHQAAVCDDCRRQETIDFFVPARLYQEVLEGEQAYVCLLCFDRRARRLDIPYWSDVTLLGQGSWMVLDYDAHGGLAPDSEPMAP